MTTLVERLAEAMSGSVFDAELEPGWQRRLPTNRERAERILPLVAAEVEAAVSVVRAENEHLRGDKAMLIGMRNSARRHGDQATARAVAAESEVRALREKVAKVEADLAEANSEARIAHGLASDRKDEVDRLTHLLGSHADGHCCTCTMTDLGVYHGDNMHPPEWEQDPWCPTHPDVGSIRLWIGELAEKWSQEADHGEDERYGRVIARTLRSCATELAALSDPTDGRVL